MVELIVIVIPVGCSALLWCVADKRGLNTLFWAIIGAVLGPFAIPFIFLAKEQSRSNGTVRIVYLNRMLFSFVVVLTPIHTLVGDIDGGKPLYGIVDGVLEINQFKINDNVDPDIVGRPQDFITDYLSKNSAIYCNYNIGDTPGTRNQTTKKW